MESDKHKIAPVTQTVKGAIMAYCQKSEKSDVYQVVTDRIIGLLEQGVAPWRKPWSGGDSLMPKNLVSGKAYQGINIFLLGCQPYDSPYWLTFKQAQERGGHVRKGEKGSPCIFWKTYEKEKETPDGDIEAEKRWVLRYYVVFNADQCDGIEAPKPEVKIYPENERIDRAEAIQLAMPNRPSVTYGGSSAYYDQIRDLVNVPELNRFESSEEFYSALFHELAHSTGHENRLNRDMSNGHTAYGKEELVAEMTSAYICAHCGIENATIENSAAYLQGWIKALKGDRKLAVVAATQAQKAANYILNLKFE